MKANSSQALIVNEVLEWSQKFLGNQANLVMVEPSEQFMDAHGDNLSDEGDSSKLEVESDHSGFGKTESFACMPKIEEVCTNSSSEILVFLMFLHYEMSLSRLKNCWKILNHK